MRSRGDRYWPLISNDPTAYNAERQRKRDERNIRRKLKAISKASKKRNRK